MTEPHASRGAEGRLRGWRWLALAWLLVLVAVAWHHVRFWQAPRIDSDILALLPMDAGDPAVADATRRIAGNSARDVVVMLGAVDAEAALRARDAFEAAVRASTGDGAGLLVAERSPEDWFAQARAALAPYRDRLLTEAQRRQLEQTPADALAESALAARTAPWGRRG